jgi:hypothetical protein
MFIIMHKFSFFGPKDPINILKLSRMIQPLNCVFFANLFVFLYMASTALDFNQWSVRDRIYIFVNHLRPFTT